ncbi:MAG TPA: MATE family efflux transporter [Myxococcota bacterium]|nr:MATE family efflux transporter [Myxococcota bacterium]
MPVRPEAEDPSAESDEAALSGGDPPDDPEAGPALPSAALASRAARAAAPARTTTRPQTEREIWALAWPVILSQVLASIVSLVDMGMVGRLGRDAQAAVTYTSQFQNLAQSILFAVGTACVALIARAVGAREPRRARTALAGSLVLSAGIAGGFTALVLALPRPLLVLLDAAPHVVNTAIPYFRLTLGSTLFLAVSIIIESAFRATRRTELALLIALVVTVAKIILNLLLMFGTLGFPRLELVGAGLATLISQIVAVVLFAATSQRSGEGAPLRLSTADFVSARPMLGPITRIALPAIGERVILQIAIMTYVTVLGHYGTADVAAYGIGTRLMSFSWIPGTGFSVAAATLVGQALGARQPEEAARAGWRAARFALIVSIILGLAFGLARGPIARLFTSDQGVVEALGPFMLLLALAQPPMGVHFTLGGALRGAGDTWTVLVAATLGNWGFRVPIALVASAGLQLDVVWVWAALIADHFARAVWLTISFRGGKWQNRGD